jgi:hypothetical protein
MEITNLSTMMEAVKAMQAVQVSIMKNTLEQVEMQGEAIKELIKTTSVDISV